MNQLPLRPTLPLAAARAMAQAAGALAEEHGWAVSIAIVDDAGRLLLFERMDGAPNASVDVALSKALHACNYRRPTRFHQDILQGGNMVVLALPDALPLEGGVPVTVGDVVVGAVGVSGVQFEDDGRIAAAAVAALHRWLEG